MVWICDQNILENIGDLAIAEQCLHSVKAFSASHAALPASRLGVHKRLGGDTDGTADPKRPQGYSIPYSVMLSK